MRALVLLAALAAPVALAQHSHGGRPAPVRTPEPESVWINEIHHSNRGTDVDEGVEIAGRAGTDLAGWHLHVYSGYGTPYGVASPGRPASASLPLAGLLGDEAGGLGAVWFALQGLRSGCNGVALARPGGEITQFLSTGGCRFNALSGPVFERAEAAGGGDPAHPDSLAWSTAIQGPPRQGPRRRVQEWNAMPAGYSLQLTGAGSTYADFAWGGPHLATRGRLNDYQAPAFRRNPTTAWKAGDAFGAPLAVPALDPGRDEDAPGDAAPAQPDDASALTVGLPAPNPASRAVRLDLTLPGDAHARVVDALGRRVLTLPLAHGATHAEIDVSALAAGVYAVRVSTDTQHATRRFTVTR